MTPEALNFIALANEFCSSLERLATELPGERADFVASMLGIIPRLYIAATDLQPDGAASQSSSSYDDGDSLLPDDADFLYGDADGYGDDRAIGNFLDEEGYEAVRRTVEAVMGDEDVYLEVFEEEMKYSDTPVAASVAEGLADMFQNLYDFVETVRDAADSRREAAIADAKEDFEHYWSRTACNLMRALNHIRYFAPSADDDEAGA